MRNKNSTDKNNIIMDKIKNNFCEKNCGKRWFFFIIVRLKESIYGREN